MSDVLSVWIVDDDESIRWVLERALKAGGCQVRCFNSGQGLTQALGKGLPDVLLTDIRMPGISGLELLSLIHI